MVVCGWICGVGDDGTRDNQSKTDNQNFVEAIIGSAISLLLPDVNV